MYTRNEKITPVYIEDEMKDSYISYAMSVIVGRALPDARDGLKPVHRRILYAMKELNIEHNKPFKKAARIVGECFVKDTLVLTEKGLRPIQDIRVGDKVYTQSGIRSVVALYEMPPKKLLRVTLKNGIFNDATLLQKFKVIDKKLGFIWKGANDLTKDDYVVVKARYPGVQELVKLDHPYQGRQAYLNRNISYLLGFLISDGWVAHDYTKAKLPRIGFYSVNKRLIEKAADILMHEFNYIPTIEKKEYRVKGKNGSIQNIGYTIRINRMELNDFFVKNFNLGAKNAFTKEIPGQILVSPKDIIFSFVSGLIDGDGCIHKQKTVIHYGSVSQKLINQLAMLLQHLGIFSSKYTDENLERGGFVDRGYTKANYKFRYLEFRGSSALLLAKNIHLFDETKQKRVQELLAKRRFPFTYDIIPYAGRHIFEELSKCHIGSGWYKDTAGNKFRMGIKYQTGCKIRYSSDLIQKSLRKSQVIDWGLREKLKKIGSPLSDFIEEIIGDDIYFLKIDSVKKISAQKTYDLQVEGEHEFVANGMVVHNCLGKYHPHGDIAVYDALIRMAQDFSLRYPLVEGQGNVGSVDGDSPAAMRYVEARLAHITDLMLQDIEKDTVKFVPNFDESMEEPTVLPAVLPNLLVNGSSGIAVGMATNIPPHNLNEVCDAVCALIENPEIDTKDLMKYVKGPDFPTGGIIRGRDGIKSAYATGRGRLKVHAKAGVEEQKSGKEVIIITELPYQVNKANLIETIANLVRDKKIEGISDLRDESDKDGMRIVVELRRGENAQVVLNNLYKHTQMQETFGVIMLALVNGKPQVLNLKQLLEHYIAHRKNIIIRRTKFDLNKAQERAHILEGLKIALDNLDKIIKLIKQSKNPQIAKEGLMKNFDLSERQSIAILEMQLQRLTALEREKIDEEYLELIKKIEFYKAILESEKKVLDIIKTEVGELKEKFGDPRRTEILSEVEELNIEDLITEEDVVITISHSSYVKRLPVSAYRKQKRGGKGVTGADMKEEDFIEHLFIASTHDFILFFTNKGRVHWVKVHEIPQASRQSRGKAIVNLKQLEQGETISAYIPVREFKEGHYLVMATKSGVIKKTELSAFANPRKGGIIGITLDKGDELIQVQLTDGKKELFLATMEGKAIRFSEDDVRDMGRAAKGVRGIRLGKKDVLIAMEVVEKDATLLTVTDNGFGKRTDFSEYRVQSRGGKGIINIKAGKKNGLAIGVKSVTDKDEFMLITSKGMIVRCAVKDIRTTGRSTQGVRLMKLDDKDKVASIARVIAEEEGETD